MFDSTPQTQHTTTERRRALSEKIISVDDAMALLKSGDEIVTSMAATEPYSFYSNIARRAEDLENLHVTCANPVEDYPCFASELTPHISFDVLFVTHPVRKRMPSSNLSYVPQHLSQWVHNILSRRHINVFWGSCSYADESGTISLGPGACYEPEMLKAADLVILEMNKHIPVCHGDTMIHTDDVDYFIKNNRLLPSLTMANMSEVDLQIGELVASLVEDGSTIQLGIGGIPNAITQALLTKSGLGVHTEMINDCIMQLAKAGVVTGENKTRGIGKIVGAFALGTEGLYEFVNHNPMIEFRCASHVNDPYEISQNHKMKSINTAVEVDLTGQVCSESLGHFGLSGVGGAADTHVGAQRSKGGRGIIALRSCTNDGSQSKICFELKPGAKISVSRNDVDTIVTEQGIASLRGLSVRERVNAMIAIAHPDFRTELRRQARDAGYLTC